MGEDDTFRLLRRISFNEMKELLDPKNFMNTMGLDLNLELNKILGDYQ